MAQDIENKKINSKYFQHIFNRIDRLAHLTYDRFHIPGTNWHFGIDGLIGLVPGVGDAVTTTLSFYIVWQAWRMGATKNEDKNGRKRSSGRGNWKPSIGW